MILEEVAILDQILDLIGNLKMTGLDTIMIDTDQIEEDQTAGQDQTMILDLTLDLILEVILDIGLMIDHHLPTTVLNPMTDHLRMIIVEMTEVTGQDMANISHMINPLTEEVVKMTVAEKISEQATEVIEEIRILEISKTERIPHIINLEVHPELLIIEVTLEIDPLADTTTGIDLESILEIDIGMSPETNLETSQKTSPETTLEINHGAVKDHPKNIPH